MTVTIDQFIAMAETVVRNHTPYVLGGISLTRGCDCSGMIYGSRIALGLPAGPRTTQQMYATWQRIPVGQQRIGDLPIFDVPSDGGSAPQHIGVLVSGGVMVEEPHTGAFGSVVAIPNSAGESLMGYLRMPDVVPAVAPPPIREEDVMYAFQNAKGQTVLVGTQQSTGHTVVVTSGSDQKVNNGWSLDDITAAIEAAYPGTVVVVE